jgi:hypothetical protein
MYGIMKTTFAPQPFRPSPQNKPIFQVYPPRGQVTIQDARDVYDICKYISNPVQKEAVYAMHGVDGEAVEKYLKTVESLYVSYYVDPNATKKDLLTRFKDFFGEIN